MKSTRHDSLCKWRRATRRFSSFSSSRFLISLGSPGRVAPARRQFVEETASQRHLDGSGHEGRDTTEETQSGASEKKNEDEK